jgi:hypothetical protein
MSVTSLKRSIVSVEITHDHENATANGKTLTLKLKDGSTTIMGFKEAEAMGIEIPMVERVVTKEDVELNQGEGLTEGETIEIPDLVPDGADGVKEPTPEPPIEEKPKGRGKGKKNIKKEEAEKPHQDA